MACHNCHITSPLAEGENKINAQIPCTPMIRTSPHQLVPHRMTFLPQRAGQRPTCLGSLYSHESSVISEMDAKTSRMLHFVSQGQSHHGYHNQMPKSLMNVVMEPSDIVHNTMMNLVCSECFHRSCRQEAFRSTDGTGMILIPTKFCIDEQAF